MLVRLKLFVKDSDTVPKLGVFDVLQRIESVLISIERFLKILNQKVAVSEGSPSRAVLRVNLRDFAVVLNS